MSDVNVITPEQLPLKMLDMLYATLKDMSEEKFAKTDSTAVQSLEGYLAIADESQASAIPIKIEAVAFDDAKSLKRKEDIVLRLVMTEGAETEIPPYSLGKLAQSAGLKAIADDFSLGRELLDGLGLGKGQYYLDSVPHKQTHVGFAEVDGKKHAQDLLINRADIRPLMKAIAEERIKLQGLPPKPQNRQLD